MRRANYDVWWSGTWRHQMDKLANRARKAVVFGNQIAGLSVALEREREFSKQSSVVKRGGCWRLKIVASACLSNPDLDGDEAYVRKPSGPGAHRD